MAAKPSLFGAVFAFTLGAGRVHAEPTPPPPSASTTIARAAADIYPLPSSPTGGRDPARAATERARGAQLSRLRAYAGAKDAYRRAYALSGKTEDGRAVADAAEAEGDLAEAADVIAFLLGEADPPPSPAERAKLTAKLGALESSLGALVIDAKTAGASVAVDGRERGTTPIAAVLRLTPGTHFVHVRKRDMDPFESMLEVAAGTRETVTVTLKPPVTTAPLRVKAQGATQGARVFVDGKEMGPVPWEGDVDVATHVVVVKSVRATSAETPVRVVARRGTDVTVDVAELVTPIRIIAEPLQTSISIDGKVVGQGRFDGNLPPGKVNIALQATGYATKSFILDVSGTEPISRDVELSPLAPKPAAAPAEDPSKGFYGGIAAAGHIDVTAPSSPCPEGATCDDGTPAGAALVFDVGYRFGWFGLGLHVQGLGALGSSKRSTSASSGSPTSASFDESVVQYEYGTFVGVSPRLITPAPFGFTAGLTPGVSIRELVLHRAASGGINETYNQDTGAVVAPSAMLDAGLVFGSTPGAKLHFGVYGLATYHGEDVGVPSNPFRSSGSPRLAASAFQMTLGAQLGVFFGH